MSAGATKRVKRRPLELASSLLVLASIFAASWFLWSVTHGTRRPARVSAPRISLTPSERRAAAHFPSFRGALPVLAVGPLHAGSQGPGLTATTLARELALLRAAGFTTVSTKQVAGFTRGRPLPQKPLLLCVDGSADSAWRIADPILERVGMRALLLLPPGELMRGSRYYLPKAALAELAHSSRWQIGLLMRPGDDPARIVRWLGTLATRGIDASAALAFSTEPSARQLERMTALRSRFLLVLADSSQPRYANAGDRLGALPRLSLPTSARRLLPLLARLMPRPADDQAPLERVGAWQAEGRAPPPVAGVLRLAPPPRTWQAALYDPAATATWSDYRVRVFVAGLSPVASGTLMLRITGARRLALTVSSVSLTAAALDGGHRRPLGTVRLVARSQHHVVALVNGRLLAVRIDGALLLRTGVPAALTRGGLGLGAWRENANTPALRFSDLSVQPA